MAISDTENFPKVGYVDKPNKLKNIVIEGRGNFVDPSAENVMVNGDSNSVGYNVKDSTILGSSGCVILSGLRNVQIYNSSGVVATESDSIYVFGESEREISIQTANTTPVNAINIVQPNNSTMSINVEAISISAGFDINYGGKFFSLSKCLSSTTTVFGTNSNEFVTGGVVSAVVFASGQNVIIQLTGESTVMNWKIKYSTRII